jgi:hypothetical protein
MAIALNDVESSVAKIARNTGKTGSPTAFLNSNIQPRQAAQRNNGQGFTVSFCRIFAFETPRVLPPFQVRLEAPYSNER